MILQELQSVPFAPVTQCYGSFAVRALWLIPALPMLAAGIIALLKQPRRRTAATLAIGSLAASLLLSLAAFAQVLLDWLAQATTRETICFSWLQFGSTSIDLGWILDPLSATMLVMVSFVGLLIFIYSLGYMAHEENATRFFCFLALFAGAMLGVVIANSILLLYICWELVGLTSYLLIGFWYQRPAAAAAAKKAFLTTRIGDVFFFLGIVWLFAQTGTLLFYKNGAGAIEPAALQALLAQPAAFGLSAATAIALLLFAGAVGKSGQLPLHVWLPDAMEGPTPVSALIHAATMVAAGVYLIARAYPLMSAGAPAGGTTVALSVVTWVGTITAVFAALIAVAQNDIKRILAYSTISQLGYMMAGLGLGGVAVGFFHLITHAFFKALLFLGAGSVIHGCHDEQDIRKMGGLKADMPLTFLTYAAGMLALSGFVPFAGFWSKDGLLDAAFAWKFSSAPFYFLLFGALLTAFYMMRQVSYVFFGFWRGQKAAHESPVVMTAPLAILAVFALLLGLLGTPVWPWFQSFVEGRAAHFDLAVFHEPELLLLLSISTIVVLAGLFLGWRIYGNRSPEPDAPDPLEAKAPHLWRALGNRLYVDEFYEATILAFYAWWARVAVFFDRWIWGGAVSGVAAFTRLFASITRFFDQAFVNGGFDKTCEELATGGGLLARVQSGRAQSYLRILAVAVVALAVILLWSSRL